ncbi:CoA transferase subunit A [Aquibacillus rhizosphaerae]|uniref:CoA transferase subunit A n=1 Tax=Aquibacillus rhizosphaerae TaxID=3051431 RepID=A0ABT7L0A1_9BACI|nr:CoA transferase subunit A [Aquibacillus sp. LR5S19]MDL4839177.1 CoA transferase subunit A [Aquibacillus sp. LR5S19]
MLKPIINAKDAVKHVEDGAVIMFGGFLNAAETLVDALVEANVKNLTIISNDTCYENTGVGKLIKNKQVKKAITCHIGTNPETQRQMNAGELEVEIVPMGTLVEKVRAGGTGLGGVLTPTGLGTKIAERKQIIEVNGQSFIVEPALKADIAFIQASICDKKGNLFHKGTTRNWNPIMAMAAETVIVETDSLVEVGHLDPETVHTPNIFIDYIVCKEGSKIS